MMCLPAAMFTVGGRCLPREAKVVLLIVDRAGPVEERLRAYLGEARR